MNNYIEIMPKDIIIYLSQTIRKEAYKDIIDSIYIITYHEIFSTHLMEAIIIDKLEDLYFEMFCKSKIATTKIYYGCYSFHEDYNIWNNGEKNVKIENFQKFIRDKFSKEEIVNFVKKNKNIHVTSLSDLMDLKV